MTVTLLGIAGCMAVSHSPVNKTAALQLAKEWNEMVFEKGGCLCGSQDWRPNCSFEGSIFTYGLKDEWEAFSARPLSQTVPFLTGCIDSTRETRVHTCPFQMAIEGEAAVYFLQHLLHANWIEYRGDNRVIQEGIVTHRKHHQNAIRHVLADAGAREELKRYFLEIWRSREKR